MLRESGQGIRLFGQMSTSTVLHEWREDVDRPVVAMSKSYPANYQGYLHHHTRAQLLYAVSGSIRMNCALGCWIIPPQRAVWIPPRHPHQTASVGPMEMRTLYIQPEHAPPLAPLVPVMLGMTALLRELILRIVAMPPEYDPSGQDALLIQAALGEIDWTPLSPISLPVVGDARLRQMEQAITNSTSDRSSLEQWAVRLHMSSRTLMRLIREQTNLSFTQWRDQMRTFTAIPLLSEGKTIAEIADAVGFDNASSFTAMFKRLTGILPSRYS